VGFGVDKVTLRQVSLRVLLFSPVIIKPPALRTDPYLDITIMKRLSGQSLETLNPKAVLSDKEHHWTEASALSCSQRGQLTAATVCTFTSCAPSGISTSGSICRVK